MIGTAMAILGAAAIGGGASLLASHSAEKSAENAASSNAATQRGIYDQTRSDLQPYTQGGYTALAALLGTPGLTTAPHSLTVNHAPAPANTSSVDLGHPGNSAHPPSTGGKLGNGMSIDPASAGPAAGPATGAPQGAASSDTVPDWKSYLAANPDIEKYYNQTPAAQTVSLEDFAADVAQKQGDLRGPVPTMAAPPPPTDNSYDAASYGQRPAAVRPDYASAPTFGEGPSISSYVDPSKFAVSPDYQWRLSQGMRNVNAGFGAKGLLQSGAALQGFNDYAQGAASQEYQNWFGRQQQQYQDDASRFDSNRTVRLAQYNQDRNVFNTNYNYDTSNADNNFNLDRNFAANRSDTRVNNLFQLAGIGQGAANAGAAAGQNYANNTTANNNTLATVQGNAAIAGANGITGAVNSAAQAYGYYQNPFSVGANPTGRYSI